jgi:hypothetical protein
MSTRSIWTFIDKSWEPEREYHVYKHYDGYPAGASAFVINVLLSELAWRWPRFEADEFAAAFIAANKVRQGDIRLCKSRTDFTDVGYGYTLWVDYQSAEPLVGRSAGTLMIEVAATDYWDDTFSEKVLYTGSVMGFLAEFPPYYATTEDAAGRVLLRDERDPGAIRYRDEMKRLRELGYK